VRSGRSWRGCGWWLSLSMWQRMRVLLRLEDCEIECEPLVIEARVARPDRHDVGVVGAVGRALCALA
jgi:hypothetical protein